MPKPQTDGAAFAYLIAGGVFIGAVVVFSVIAEAIALAVLMVWGIYKLIQANAKPHDTSSSTKTLELINQANLLTVATALPTAEQFSTDTLATMMDVVTQPPRYEICAFLDNLFIGLFGAEGLTSPPVAASVSSELDQARLRDALQLHMGKLQDPATVPLMRETIVESVRGFCAYLPPAALTTYDELKKGTTNQTLSVPLIDLMPQPARAVTALALPFFDQKLIDRKLFVELRSQLEANQLNASLRSRELVMPEDYKGDDIVSVYLRDTPLHALLSETRIPFALPDETRFGGMWCIAPPGRGKTTFLHGLLLEDIRKDASIIVMDSKGDLIAPLRNLREIAHRLIIIEPDGEDAIGVNPLDIPRTSITHAVDLLEYLFGSLLEFKMTALQTTLFRSVLRALVTSFPNPTLDTFRDLLTNSFEKYENYIKQLPFDLQEFFYKEFNEKLYADRRREVVQRLRLLLDNDAMRAMLLASRTRFRISDAMDQGKIIIINNSKALLGDQGSEFFGRFFIAQVLAAATARSGRKQSDKKPCYFYIDECQNVISRDDKIPTILDECRSQKIALIMAHQRTEQIKSPDVLSALSNCAIRFANSDDEARYLAPRLRSTETVLQNLKRGQFAAFVRDLTTHAVVLDVPYTDFSKHDTLSVADQAQLKRRMRTEYGITESPIPEMSVPPVEREQTQEAPVIDLAIHRDPSETSKESW